MDHFFSKNKDRQWVKHRKKQGGRKKGGKKVGRMDGRREGKGVRGKQEGRKKALYSDLGQFQERRLPTGFRTYWLLTSEDSALRFHG